MFVTFIYQTDARIIHVSATNRFCQARLFRTVAALSLAMLVACSSQQPPEPASSTTESNVATLDNLLRVARSNPDDSGAQALLQAVSLLEREGNIATALRELGNFGVTTSLSDDSIEMLMQVRIDLLLQAGRAAEAESLLTSASLAEVLSSYPLLRNRLSAQVLLDANNHVGAFRSLSAAQAATLSGSELLSLNDLIWQSLIRFSEAELATETTLASSYAIRGWLELATTFRREQFSIRSQINALAQWQRVWTSHQAARQLPSPLASLEQVWQQRPAHIALILPVQDAVGTAIHDGFLAAYFRLLEISREVPLITVIDSTGATDASALYAQAVQSGADLVVGPLNKRLVNQLQDRPLPIPTLALNYSDSPTNTNPNLYQFGLAPEDEILQSVELAWLAGYRNAAIVSPYSEDYVRLQQEFADQWRARGGNLVSSATFDGNGDYSAVVKQLMAIDASESRFERIRDLLPRADIEFVPRRRQDIDVIFMMANPLQGRQIKPTLAFHYAENVPVYALPSIYSGRRDPGGNSDLDGIVFTDAPWLLDEEAQLRRDLNTHLRETQGTLQRLRALGVDSFMVYPRLDQLRNRELITLSGTTGELRMTDDQRIHRRLVPARFENGLALPLADADIGDSAP